MKREDLLRNSGYLTTKIQLYLYKCAENFMQRNNMNRTQLAKYLGVSKGYVSQLLNGDFDHKLSKLVDLALAFEMVPDIRFRPIEEAVSEDRHKYDRPNSWQKVEYSEVFRSGSRYRFIGAKSYESVSSMSNIQKDRA